MSVDSPIKRITSIFMGVVGALIVLAGIVATYHTDQMMSIPMHHLLHAGMAVGAGMLAIALANRWPALRKERVTWAIVASLAPIFGLALMWPSEYMYLMEHPGLHSLDHLGIALFSWLAVFGAQLYVRGLGWPMLVLMVAMDAGAAAGFGVSPPPSSLLSLPLSTVTSGNMEGMSGSMSGMGPNHTMAPAPAPAAAGPYHFDAAKGSSLYSSNCMACHQATGQGLPGVFPPLRGNSAVLDPDPTRQIEVVLDGQHGQKVDGTTYSSVMPPFAATLSDTEIADIINHERSSWGNQSKQITPDEVKALRKH